MLSDTFFNYINVIKGIAIFVLTVFASILSFWRIMIRISHQYDNHHAR